MNFDFLDTEKISTLARIKIFSDFLGYEDVDVSSENLEVHAGAISLYSAALITKIYETNPEQLLLESSERENALCQAIKNSTKFKHLSDEEITTKAHEMVVKDLRNCFAHGNFEISYNINSKELYFILQPKRKDFSINVPIIISSQNLKDAIMKPIMELSFNLMFNEGNNADHFSDFSRLFKTLLLPTQMLKFADYYLEKKPIKIKPKVEGFKTNLIKYILLVTQITYEQDDYYNIFGKSSNIFERISLIRNSIAHNSFIFEELAKDISYSDRERTLSQTLIQSVAVLTTAHDMKESIKYVSNNTHSESSIVSLKDKLMECFDMFFENNNALLILSDDLAPNN